MCYEKFQSNVISYLFHSETLPTMILQSHPVNTDTKGGVI